MKDIKVVLLDIDNTLLDFNEGSKASMKLCFEKFGLEFCGEMFCEFLKINDGLWKRIEQRTLTKDELHKIRWGLVFRQLGINFDGVIFEQEFLETLKTCARPVEGAFELLSYLSEKYTVCAASNAPYDQQIARLENVGMLKYFQKLFISEKIGHPKPSAKFFDACFENLGAVPKSSVVMIGDSLTADIIGAAEYGLRTIWFNYGKSAVPGNLCADYTVNTLGEIKNIL